MFTKSALYVLALTVAVPSFRCGQRLTLAAEAEMLHHHLGHHRDTHKKKESVQVVRLHVDFLLPHRKQEVLEKAVGVECLLEPADVPPDPL